MERPRPFLKGYMPPIDSIDGGFLFEISAVLFVILYHIQGKFLFYLRILIILYLKGITTERGERVTKTELLDRHARDGEQRLLLGRVLDKLELAQKRAVPSYTQFLSPSEGVAVEDLLSACGHPRHLMFGGFSGAERCICIFLPDWQEEEDVLNDMEGPITALEAAFHSHRKL